MADFVFHITARAAYAVALDTGAYEAPSLASEGFIHCSTREQITRSAGKFFHGQSGLVVLCLDARKLAPKLRYEPADGQLFPHFYGQIPIDAIAAVIDFPPRSDGDFDLPEELALFG